MSAGNLTGIGDGQLTKIILDTVPSSISFRDTENRILYINKHAAERYLLLAGAYDSAREWSPEDFLGKSLTEIFGEGVMAETEDLIASVVTSGEAITDREFVGPRSSGIFMLSITPLVDDQQHIVGTLTVATDVTKRRTEERAARQGDTFNRAIMANLIDAIIVIDKHDTIRTFNQAAEKLFGYRADAMIGRPVSELMTEADRDHHQGYIDRYLATGKSKILGKGPREVIGRHQNGEPMPLELNIGRIDGEGEVLFVGSLRDISRRKEAERALQQSQGEAAMAQQLLADAIDSIPEGFALYDADRRLILHNETLRRMYPNTVDEFERGATFDEILLAAARSGAVADAFGREDEWIAERSRTFGEVGDGIEQQLADGRWILISDRTTRDGGVVSVRTDITELKQREDELRQAQKMEALGQLTGGVAHDFNNLLAIMMGNIALLEEELGPDNPLLELTEPTMRAIDQATEVTSRMLSFARRQPLRIQSIDLNKLLTDLQPLLRQALVEEIAIVISTPANLWPCHADLSQLEQAILNLAINARDAMPQGGKLHIETSNITLPDAGRTDHPELPRGQYVIIAITDTGQGIAATDLPKIFDPFFTTKGVGKGSGLGLSMVHGFAKQSNGDVLVQSEVGAGSTFCIYLPRADAAEDKALAAALPVAPSPGADETILLVEDEEDVRTMMARSLEKLGYKVLTAVTGPAGLQELERHGPVDLLLTDVLLPGGLNGQQLADQATASYPGLKVLFMSGYARDEIVDQGRLRTDVRLLSKPFSQSELGQRVRDILDET